MTDSLGRLELGLGVDLPGFESDLIAANQRIEAYKSKWQGMRTSVSIKPTVDDSALTALNKHLSLKQTHLAQVRADFAKPLMVTADYTTLDEYSRKLDKLSQQSRQTLGSIGRKTQIDINIDASKLARSIQDSIEKGMKAVNPSGIFQSIARGAFESLGANLAGGGSKIISQQFSAITSGTIGSPELIKQKLAELGTARIQKFIAQKRSDFPVIDNIITSTSERVRGGLGEREIAIEANKARGVESRKKKKDLHSAQQGIVVERQSAISNYKNADIELGNANARKTEIESELNQLTEKEAKYQAYVDRSRTDENNRLAKAKSDRIAVLRERRESAIDERRKSTIDRQLSAIDSSPLSSKKLRVIDEEESQIFVPREMLDNRLSRASADVRSKEINFRVAEERARVAKRQQEALQRQQQPKNYQEILDEIAPGLDPTLVPKLELNQSYSTKGKGGGIRGTYSAASNTIALNPETYRKVYGNKPLSKTDRDILLEEVLHGSDFRFGQFEGVEAVSEKRLLDKKIKATPAEELDIEHELRLYDKDVRPIERQAKIRRDRSQKAYAQQQTLDRVTDRAGGSGLDYFKATNKDLSSVGKTLDLVAETKNKNDLNIPALERLQSKHKQLTEERNSILSQVQSAQAGDVDGKEFTRIEFELDLNLRQIQSLKTRTKSLGSKLPAIVDPIRSKYFQIEDPWGIQTQTGPRVKLALPTKQPELDYVGIGQQTTVKALSAAQNMVQVDYEPLPLALSGGGNKKALPSNTKGASPNAEKLQLTSSGDLQLPLLQDERDWKIIARQGIVNTRRKLDKAIKEGNKSISTQLFEQFGRQVDEFQQFISPEVVGISESITNKGVVGKWKKVQADRAKKIEQITDISDDSFSSLASRKPVYYNPKPAIPNPTANTDASLLGEDDALASLNPFSWRRRTNQRRKPFFRKETASEQAARESANKLNELESNFEVTTSGFDEIKRSESIAKVRNRRKKAEEARKVNFESDRLSQERSNNVVAGAGGDIDSQFSKFAETARKIDEQFGEFDRIESDTSRDKNKFGRAESRIRRNINRFNRAASRVSGGGGGGGGGGNDDFVVDDIPQSGLGNAAELDRIKESIDPMKSLGNAAKTAAGSFLAFQGAMFVGGLIRQWGTDALQTSIAFENLAIAGKAVSSSDSTATRSINSSRALANKLGFNPIDVVQSVQGFKSATLGTDLEGIGDTTVGNTTKYARLVGLNPQEFTGVQRQIIQLAGKANATQEDIGQAEENLPGFSALLARGLGTTVAGLRKQTSAGTLSGVDAIQALNVGLASATSGSKMDEALNSTSAALGRAQGAVTNLQQAVGDQLLAPVATGAKLAGGALDGLSSNAETFATVFVATMLVAGTAGVIFAGKMALAAAGVVGLGSAMTAILPLAGSFALVTGAVYLAIEGFKALSASAEPSAFKKYSDEVGKLSGRLSDLKNKSDKANESLSSPARKAQEDKFLPNRGFVDAAIDTYDSTFRATNRFFGREDRDIRGNLGNSGDSTSRKQRQELLDVQLAQSDISSILKKPLGSEKLGKEFDPYAIGNQKADIDSKIIILRQEQSLLPASDRTGTARVQKEIQDLITKSSTLTDPLTDLLSVLQNQKKGQQEIIDSGTYADNPAILNAAKINVDLLGTRASELEKIISKVRDGLTELDLSIRKSSGRLGQSLNELRDTRSIRDTRINKDAANKPLDTGLLANQLYDSLQKDIANRRLVTKQAITENDNFLRDPSIKNGIELFQKSGDLPKDLTKTSDEQLSNIKALGASDNQIGRIKAARELNEQLLAQDAEASSSTREYRQALAENARSIRDYNQSLVFQAQRTTIDVQQTQHSIESQGFANKLRTSLAGVNDRFSAYFNASIDILVESGKSVDIETNRRKAQSQAEEARMKALQDNDQRQEQTRKSSGDSGSVIQPRSNESGVIASPLKSASINDLISYKPLSEGINSQGFTASRKRSANSTRVDGYKAGAQVHGANDYDERVGGGVGGIVQAPISGLVSEYDAGKKMGRIVQVTGRDAQGKDTIARLTHIKPKVKTGDFVRAGQEVGSVVENNVGSKAHLDFSVIQDGVKIDPQKWFAKNKTANTESTSAPKTYRSVPKVAPISGTGTNYDRGLLSVIAAGETDYPDKMKSYHVIGGGTGGMTGGRILYREMLQEGWPKSIPKGRAAGRYQLHKVDFEEARKKDPSIKGFTAKEQDKIAMLRLQNPGLPGRDKGATAYSQFSENPSFENFQVLRRDLGAEWESKRDGKTRYRGKDLGINFMARKGFTDRSLYQKMMTDSGVGRPQMGTIGAGIAGKMLPKGTEYDLRPPTPLGTNTTPEQQVGQIKDERIKINDDFKANEQLRNANATAQKLEAILKIDAAKANRAANDRKLRRQDADKELSSRRKIEDAQLSTGYDTPGRIVKRQDVKLQRDSDDTLKDLSRTREDLGYSAISAKKYQREVRAKIANKDAFARNTPAEQQAVLEMDRDLKKQIPELERTIKAYDKLIIRAQSVSKSVANDANRKARDKQQGLNVTTESNSIASLITLRQEQLKQVEIFQRDRPTDFSKGDPLVLKKEIAILQADMNRINKKQELTEKRRVADPLNQSKIDAQIKNADLTANAAIDNANKDFNSAVDQRSIGFSRADTERSKARAGSYGALGSSQAELFKVERKANPFDYSKSIASIEGAYQISVEQSRHADAKREIKNQSRIDKTQEAHFEELARLENRRHQLQIKAINKSIDLAEIEEQISGRRAVFDKNQFDASLRQNVDTSFASVAKAERRDLDAQRMDDEIARARLNSEYDRDIQTQLEIKQRSPGDPNAETTYENRVQVLIRKLQLDLQAINTNAEFWQKEREFSQGSKLNESRSSLISAGADRANLAGNAFDGRKLSYQAAVIQQGQEFRSKKKELEEQQKAVIITTDQFKQLSNELELLNNIKLDNLARQFDPVTDAIKSVGDSFSNLLGSFTGGEKGLDKAFKDFLASPFKAIQNEANKYLTSALSQQLTSWFKPTLKNAAPIDPNGIGEVLGATPSPTNYAFVPPRLPDFPESKPLKSIIPPPPSFPSSLTPSSSVPIIPPPPPPALISEAKNSTFGTSSISYDRQPTSELFPRNNFTQQELSIDNPDLILVGNKVVDRRSLPQFQSSYVKSSTDISFPDISKPEMSAPSFPLSLAEPLPVAIVSDATPDKAVVVETTGNAVSGGSGDKVTRSLGNSIINGLGSVGRKGSSFNILGSLAGFVTGLFADGGVVGDEPLEDLPAYAIGGIHQPPKRFEHGILPGWSTKDDTLAVVMGGESFLTQKATARLGREGVDALNEGRTPSIFMPNFNQMTQMSEMANLPRYENGGIHGIPDFSSSSMSSATSFGDNISNIGGASNYSFVLNNNGSGSDDVSGSMKAKEIIRAESMDMILRLKRQGVI